MAGTDDLATLFGKGEGPRPYAQGIIKTWNPDTFENTVDVYGDEHVDLPVKSSVEALTYQAGDTVILARWPGSRGGAATWWIDGRAVIPGTGRGAEAIAFMTTALGEAVAKSVIGNSVFSDDADGQIDITDTSFSFVSAPDGNGPSLTDVPIGPSGRAIVLISANILAAPTGSGSSEVSALIGYEVSGATSVAASSENAGQLSQVTGLSDDSDISITVSATRMSLLTGLNEGLHNFEAKYQVTEFQTGDEGSFIFRNITVIAF